MVPWSHIGILMHHLAAEPGSTTRVLFTSQCPSGMILLTGLTLSSSLCSMVWDWCVSRVGPILILALAALSESIITIVFYYFSLSLLPVYRLVLWGWGLSTDMV